MYTQTNLENTGIPYVAGGAKIPGYNHGDALFFDEESTNHTMMILMADFLLRMYTGKDLKTVMDVGSGAGSLGYWLKLMKPDLEVVCLDGNRATIDSPFVDKDTHFVVRTDEEYTIMRGDAIAKFDLIVSFEHVEHIEPHRFEVFMDNIRRHSDLSTVFFATASKWEYPTEDEKHIHCNVKDTTEWKQYFKEQPYVLGSAIGDMASVSEETWERQPLFVKTLYDCLARAHGEFPDEVEAWRSRLISSCILVMRFVS
tara:strand:+ start:322 stop:1089 length:768 start_codon:yes stop_codon:yes gene_type:complete